MARNFNWSFSRNVINARFSLDLQTLYANSLLHALHWNKSNLAYSNYLIFQLMIKILLLSCYQQNPWSHLYAISTPYRFS